VYTLYGTMERFSDKYEAVSHQLSIDGVKEWAGLK
jgi:hypothetical protein